MPGAAPVLDPTRALTHRGTDAPPPRGPKLLGGRRLPLTGDALGVGFEVPLADEDVHENE